jgi:hypothetical protein
MSILLSILLDALASDIFDEITNVDLISATKRQIARGATKAAISKIDRSSSRKRSHVAHQSAQNVRASE